MHYRFFGFLRAGEFTVESLATFEETVHITTQDVSVDSVISPTMIRLRLKQSKTDPFRHGAVITLGRTRQDSCPVSALLSYLVQRGKVGGPLFTFSDRSSLSRQKLVSEVQRALASEGMSCKGFPGHSFRIGAATTAKAKGVADSTQKTLGRWKSNAFQLYIRLPGTDLASVSCQLVS